MRLLAVIAMLASLAGAGGEEARPAASTLCSGALPSAASGDFRASYCDVLKPMNEPVSPISGRAVEAYRLLYLRSFHPLIALRLEIRSGNEAVLYAKQLLPHSTRVQYARRAGLTPTQIAEFRALIASQRFWTAPSGFHVEMGFGPFASPIPRDAAVVMSDGAHWVVEGMDANRYHVMGDDGGAFDGPVREIGMAMLDMAKKKLPMLDVEPIY